MKTDWTRVSRSAPCVICQKPDWCTFSVDLGLACCMRVQSERAAKNGGYLHKIDAKAAPRPRSVARPAAANINCAAIMAAWKKATSHDRLRELAQSIGVDPLSVALLGAVWAETYRAFAFPMRNGRGEIVGIRLRNSVGEKWAVKGSHAGLFIPEIQFGPSLYIVEGPTDCAAALTLGLSVIGRPSCAGTEEPILDFIARRRIRQAIIISDNDGPGIAGAERLQGMLRIPSCFFLPPAKDIREFLLNGGTKPMLEALLANLVWTRPKT